MGRRGRAWPDSDVGIRYCQGETLQQIGSTYGVTHERIRQVLRDYFPHINTRETRRTYTEAKLRAARERYARQKVEMKWAIDVCRQRGFTVAPCSRLTVLVNGHKVRVASARHTGLTHPGSLTPYYRYSIGSVRRIADLEFVIVVMPTQERAMVIPMRYLHAVGGNMIYWSATLQPNTYNRNLPKIDWLQFLDAWRLLAE